jgi:hypothetical protein
VPTKVYTLTQVKAGTLAEAEQVVRWTFQQVMGTGEGSISWPVTIVSATSAIYLVPTTIDGASLPQVGKLDYDADGFARIAVGFAYPGLFGEKTGDLRLNATDGFFAGTCGGTATARLLMPAHGASVELEANTILFSGQGFTLDILGHDLDGWVSLSTWRGAITHAAATRTYLTVGYGEQPLTITSLSGLKCSTGSGTLTIVKNGDVVASEAFTTSSGGSGDDRTVSVTITSRDEVYAESTGTFTWCRVGVVGTKY